MGRQKKSCKYKIDNFCCWLHPTIANTLPTTPLTTMARIELNLDSIVQRLQQDRENADLTSFVSPTHPQSKIPKFWFFRSSPLNSSHSVEWPKQCLQNNPPSWNSTHHCVSAEIFTPSSRTCYTFLINSERRQLPTTFSSEVG